MRQRQNRDRLDRGHGVTVQPPEEDRSSAEASRDHRHGEWRDNRGPQWIGRVRGGELSRLSLVQPALTPKPCRAI
jgi:hypothetical protein